MDDVTPKEMYEEYASAMCFVEVRTPEGGVGRGAAFHVGDGIFVTARHVVEGNEIVRLILTSLPSDSDTCGGRFTRTVTLSLSDGPFFAEKDRIDIAVFRAQGCKEAAAIPMGMFTDDMLGDEMVLDTVLIMGYPIWLEIPQLFASRAEVNAVITKDDGNTRFIVSTMARGGFSGGPAISEGVLIGMVTESLVEGESAAELGFMAVLPIEEIGRCLWHHKMVPDSMAGLWDWLG